MSIDELKEKLHRAIEATNDEDVLDNLLWVVKNRTDFEKESLSAEEIKILEELEAKYLSGEEKSIPMEEFNQQLRKKYGL